MCNSFFKIFLKKFLRGKIPGLFWGLNEIFSTKLGAKRAKTPSVFFRRGCKALTGQRSLSLLRGSCGGASLRNRSPLPWCSNCACVCSNLFRRARIRAHACSKVEHAKSRTKVRLFFVFRICIYVYIIYYLVSLKTSRFLTQ